MKRKTIYPSLFAGLWLLMSVGLNSCIKDTVLDDCDCACVITSLSNVKTRGGALFTENGDAVIEKVRVLVFVSGNGGLERNVLFVKDTEEFQNPFEICRLVKGVKDVYIVANETADLNLDAIANRSELLAKMANVINAPIDGTKPILMTGEATGKDLNSITSVTMPLTRVAAKISLKFKKENAADIVKITKVSLLSNAGKTTLYPVPPATGSVFPQSYWNWVYPLTTELEVAITETVIPDYENIYLYENLAGSAGNKENATQLEVEAMFNNIPTTYRVYINETIAAPGDGVPGNPNSSTIGENADHLYKIRRNHHYVITGTISDLGEFKGLEVIYQIAPWELFNTSLFMDYGYRVEVDENGKVTVKNTLEACEPHSLELRTVGDFKFSDNSTTKVFSSLVENASASYTLNPVPAAGDGNYLEVYYNDVKVKTFTK